MKKGEYLCRGLRMKTLTIKDIDLLEQWWVAKARKNFLAYRQYMRHGDFLSNWFIEDLCKHFQQFYCDLRAGLRPMLFISTPPQMGKSWTVIDFLGWLTGRDNTLRIIYATYSDVLGIRCNLGLKRQLTSEKYQKIFPETKLPEKRGDGVRTSKHLEFLDISNRITSGQFRNTTVGGGITGETLTVGVIDDAVKGRDMANSITWSQKIWEWFTDDFSTRFAKNAGLIIIMTRWSTHDIIARLLKKKDNFKNRLKILNYQAIATKDEKHRKYGEALFPELKPLEFLQDQKSTMSEESWESLYQCNPTISGGNIFKDEWWQWYKVLPKIKYKFITADTAQKTKTHNDWTVFQCWGYGYDDNIYLLDKLRLKLQAPELRTEAEIFYNKHNRKRDRIDDPILRTMYIEDKSSGTGLIQELKKKGLRIEEVPRITDKILRAKDVSQFVKVGKVYLNTNIHGIDNITKEAREFPDSEFDDDIDTLMTAVEVTYINIDVVKADVITSYGRNIEKQLGSYHDQARYGSY